MKKLLFGGAAAFGILLAGQAAAQPPQGRWGGALGPNGELTRQKAEELARGQLGRLDANHDGVITNDEIEKIIDRMSTAGVPPEAAERIRGMMTRFGKDGRIVIADVVKQRLETFDKYDTNHDGKLDANEMAAARAAEGGPPRG